MMCHRIGFPPISTMGLGRRRVSSDNRVPNPPAKISTFIIPPIAITTPHYTKSEYEKKPTFKDVGFVILSYLDFIRVGFYRLPTLFGLIPGIAFYLALNQHIEQRNQDQPC